VPLCVAVDGMILLISPFVISSGTEAAIYEKISIASPRSTTPNTSSSTAVTVLLL